MAKVILNNTIKTFLEGWQLDLRVLWQRDGWVVWAVRHVGAGLIGPVLCAICRRTNTLQILYIYIYEYEKTTTKAVCLSIIVIINNRRHAIGYCTAGTPYTLPAYAL